MSLAVRRCLTAAGLFALAVVTGCSSAVSVGVGSSGSGRAVPLAGRYVGGLSGFGAVTSLEFRLSVQGIAEGWLRPRGAAAIPLAGRFGDDRRLVLTGGGLVLECAFTGATHPQDPRYFDRRGVRCIGEWRRGTVAMGDVSAWWDQWPPPLPFDQFDLIGFGGSTVDSSDTGDSGSSGSDSGGSSGGGTIDSGGGGLDDEIVFRGVASGG